MLRIIWKPYIGKDNGNDGIANRSTPGYNSGIHYIDNHSNGYLGMAVEHCVRAYLGPHCILAQKQYCQKLMAQLNSTAFFTPVCVF